MEPVIANCGGVQENMISKIQQESGVGMVVNLQIPFPDLQDAAPVKRRVNTTQLSNDFQYLRVQENLISVQFTI